MINSSASTAAFHLQWRLFDNSVNNIPHNFMTSSNYVLCFDCFERDTSSGKNYVFVFKFQMHSFDQQYTVSVML